MERNEKPSSSETAQYQFGGPKGVVGIIVFFTSLTYFVTEKCQSGRWDILRIPSFPINPRGYFDLQATVIVITWFALQCILYLLPVGGTGEGTMLRTCNKKLKYNLNALFVLFLNIGLLFTLWMLGYKVTILTDKLLQMLTTGIVFIFIFSIALYVQSMYVEDWKLNPNAQTGNRFYDWFMGRELNPRIGELDLKYVMFRSGIIGWIMLNTLTVLKAYESPGYASGALPVLWLMQFFYVFDYFWLEEYVSVTRDIAVEGLGFNICLQFLMIPFTFIVQTRYLQLTRYIPSAPHFGLVVLLYAIGYYIYRASNSQKNNFRKNPNDPALSHLKTMPTASGKKLLLSGWWGLCRHPNYLGDLFMSLSYGLLTGFGHFLPYLNFVFLFLMLLDREQRDSAECQRKYGKDWDKYCEHVKYRIIPYVY